MYYPNKFGCENSIYLSSTHLHFIPTPTCPSINMRCLLRFPLSLQRAMYHIHTERLVSKMSALYKQFWLFWKVTCQCGNFPGQTHSCQQINFMI